MHTAILTFDAFNEIDSLLAFHMLNRVKRPNWRVTICAPTPSVTSMNGLTITAQSTLEEASAADAVIIGSGRRTRELVNDASLMASIQLDPGRQLIAAQCSGALMLAKLGLLQGVPACTDLTTKPWVLEAGIAVLNQPFVAHGNVATAGGCLASQYLATWIIARLVGIDAAREAITYVAPVGEKDEHLARASDAVLPYLAPTERSAEIAR